MYETEQEERERESKCACVYESVLCVRVSVC